MSCNDDNSESETNINQWFADKLVAVGGLVFLWGGLWAIAPILPQHRPEGYTKALGLWALGIVLVGIGFRLGELPKRGDA